MFDIRMERPRTLDELFGRLDALRGQYKLLAGGTDMVVEARMGHHVGKTWVDVTRIPELHAYQEKADHLWLGSTVTWTEVYRSPLTQRYMPALVQCCFEVGSPQVRTLGTLGGNVAHGSPAGDSIPCLLIHDAAVVLRSRTGERTVPLEQFITGVRKTQLAQGEIILGFKIPKLAPHEARFLKLGPRESLAISKVNVAVRGRVEGGVLKDVAIALGAVAPTCLRAREAEALAEGKKPDEATLAAVAAAAQAIARPITDLRSTKEYRYAMVKVLVRRALAEIAGAYAARQEV